MISARNEGSEPHIRLPSLGVLHQEDKPPEHLALKANRAYFQETQRAMGKGHTQNLTCFGTQGRSSNLKEAWVRLTCGSQRASGRGRRQLKFILGTQMLTAATLGSSSHHKVTGAGKHHFGILPLAY